MLACEGAREELQQKYILPSGSRHFALAIGGRSRPQRRGRCGSYVRCIRAFNCDQVEVLAVEVLQRTRTLRFLRDRSHRSSRRQCS